MLQLQGTWRSHLKSEFDKPYFRALSKFVHSSILNKSVTLRLINFLMRLIAAHLKLLEL